MEAARSLLVRPFLAPAIARAPSEHARYIGGTIPIADKRDDRLA